MDRKRSLPIKAPVAIAVGALLLGVVCSNDDDDIEWARLLKIPEQYGSPASRTRSPPALRAAPSAPTSVAGARLVARPAPACGRHRGDRQGTCLDAPSPSATTRSSIDATTGPFPHNRLTPHAAKAAPPATSKGASVICAFRVPTRSALPSGSAGS